MTNAQIIHWLLQGDVSIQFQTYRDLLGEDRKDLQARIANEGWGKQFMQQRLSGGHWGKSFYQPKWISSHYTLLDLRYLNIQPENDAIQETLKLIFRHEKNPDGGISPRTGTHNSDVCVNGMTLNYACYFKVNEDWLQSVVDFILSQKMVDGGFNCQSNRKGAVHSSLHTTLSVLEGIVEYRKNGYSYRMKELESAKFDAEEFILQHRFYKSDHTGEIIKSSFLKLCYPGRWYYDILKALDYFQYAAINYDERMSDALNVLLDKRTKEGKWKVASKHSGLIHFEMEKAGQPSRWNTLRALRVLKHFNFKDKN